MPYDQVVQANFFLTWGNCMTKVASSHLELTYVLVPLPEHLSLKAWGHMLKVRLTDTI